MRRKSSRKSDGARLYIVLSGFLLAFIIVNLKLFSIQVLSHERYESMAQDQYWDHHVLPAKRGDILSREGYVLAGTQTHYLMYAEPNRIDNPREIAQDLADLMATLTWDKSVENERESTESSGTETVLVSREDFVSQLYDNYFKFMSQDLMWIALEKDLTPPQKEAIQEKNLIGIGFEEVPVRYYPENTLASHVLGFVASDESGEKQGYFGIEGYFNEDLKGKPGRVMEETDAMGIPILIGGFRKIEPIQGRSIVLTINKSVQYLVEKKLQEGVEKYDAVSGSVIVMDPSTAEIVAMANFPNYDPQDFSQPEEPLKNSPHRKTLDRRNLSVSQTYEPGSVLKAMTISAAVDSGRVTPQTTFEDNGPVWYSGYEIDNWDGKHHGTQTVIQLLQKSNNIGAAWAGHLVGSKKMYGYLSDFGLGTVSGVDLEGEDTGVLHEYKEWTDIDLATISFGQGISATPLQVLSAFNVIANGGYLLQPKVVSHIVDNDEVIEIPTKNVRRVISAESADTMVDLLESAAEGGEAKYFVLKNYRIAGKTGTAQIPEEGKYSPDRTNATFVGFLVGGKQFSMIVKLEEPKTSYYAAETAVPLWMDIATELVKFYGIPPDKDQI